MVEEKKNFFSLSNPKKLILGAFFSFLELSVYHKEEKE